MNKKCKLENCDIFWEILNKKDENKKYCCRDHWKLGSSIERKNKKFSNAHKEKISKALKGYKKTQEHKEKIAKAQKNKKRKKYSEELKIKISNGIKKSKKFNNYINSLEWKERIHKQNTKNIGKTYEQIYGKEKADAIKLKMSISHSGKNNHMFGKSPIFYEWPYKKYLMKSSWEIKYAEYLDKNNINWKYEEITYNLGETTYTPDFFIYDENNNLKEIIEIKGILREKYIKKIKLFEEKYSKEFSIFKQLFQKDLKKLKII
jgi:hypothetical protein